MLTIFLLFKWLTNESFNWFIIVTIEGLNELVIV